MDVIVTVIVVDNVELAGFDNAGELKLACVVLESRLDIIGTTMVDGDVSLGTTNEVCSVLTVVELRDIGRAVVVGDV